MPIEPSQSVGPSVNAARPVAAIDARIVQQAGGERPKGTSQASAAPIVATSEALDPGAVPVNIDRVAEVRHAIETGNYPLLPTRVADAIIAAGLLLRSPK